MRLTNISNEFLLRQVVLVTGFFAVVTFALIHSFSPGLNQYLVPVVTAVSSIVCVLTCVKKPQEVKSSVIQDYEAALELCRKSDSKLDLQANNPLSFAIHNLLTQVRDVRKQEKSVIDNAVDVICVIDKNARILQVNPASKSVWGYLPEEMLDRSLSDFLVKEDVDDTLNNIFGAEKSIDRIFFENRFLRKNGQVSDMLWSAHWSISAGGLFCVAHDITDRKRVERQLKESEERIREIFENLPTGVLVLNESGIIESLNATGCVLSGFDPKAISGLRSNEILTICNDQPHFSKCFDELISSNQSSFTSQILKDNGQRFPAEISLNRFQMNGERFYLVCFSDISQKHAIEMAKREFVSMVSHDLRTPLTSILSTLSYLEEGHGGSLSSTGATLTGRARKECVRLIELINDLLNLEKMRAGKFNMHFSKSSVKEIIDASTGAVEQFAKMHNVVVETNLSGELTCYCDGARIIQVLINLLDNAIKFSPPGGVVSLCAVPSGRSVEFSISNKGRIIPSEKLKTIFESFEQVEESDSKIRKGTGLGLAICKVIVEQHHGKMSVSSSKHEGTRFSFECPKEAEDGL